jgi:hypothetical protein
MDAEQNASHRQHSSPPFDVRREALPVFFIDLIALEYRRPVVEGNGGLAVSVRPVWPL